jgi:hypothetical protein
VGESPWGFTCGADPAELKALMAVCLIIATNHFLSFKRSIKQKSQPFLINPNLAIEVNYKH